MTTVTVTKFPEIPAFLRRNPDNTLMFPEPMGELKPLKAVPKPRQEGVQRWSEARLYEAVENSEMTVADRQPVYRELARRERKAKAAMRIAEMKARFAEKNDG
jgi:hypothetical protein